MSKELSRRHFINPAPQRTEDRLYGISPNQAAHLPEPIHLHDQPISRRTVVGNILTGMVVLGAGGLGYGISEAQKPVVDSEQVEYETATANATVEPSPIVNEALEKIAENVRNGDEIRFSSEFPFDLTAVQEKWTYVFDAENIRKFFQQFGNNVEAFIHFDYSLGDGDNDERRIPVNMFPHPPALHYIDGEVLPNQGAYTYATESGKSMFVLPGFSIGEVSLAAEVLGPEGYKRSHLVHLDSSATHPDIEENAPDSVFRIDSEVDVEIDTLFQMQYLATDVKKFGVNVWRYLVTETPFIGRLKIPDAPHTHPRHIFTITAESLPIIDNHLDNPGLLQLTREATEAIFFPDKLEGNSRLVPLLEELTHLYNENYPEQRLENGLWNPPYLDIFRMSSSHYGLDLSGIEKAAPVYTDQTNRDAIRLISEFTPLIRYLYPHLRSQIQEYQQSQPKTLVQAKPYIDLYLRILETASPEGTQALLNGNHTELRHLLNIPVPAV